MRWLHIIFELADSGDIRRRLSTLKKFDLAWTLRTLHQVAVGIKQLHTHGIAHQDVKPSNVLLFETFGAKIGDLGCADLRDKPDESPMGRFRIAGDPSYAPPELFYNEVSLEWNVRRLACDLYLLGSLIIFFFTGGASMTALLRDKILPPHSHNVWPHDYRTVLPYVRNAFDEAMQELTLLIPTSIRGEVMQLIECLCNPDPRRRGSFGIGSGQFDLQRIVSKFDVLAAKAEHNLL